MKVSMLLLASGRGERLGSTTPKAFVRVGGEPLVVRSARRLGELVPDHELILAINPADRTPHVEPLLDSLRAAGVAQIVEGGATRQESMVRAFASADANAEVVLVHDAARPFFPLDATRTAIERAAAVGGAVLATPVSDTIKRVGASHRVETTLDRSTLWAAQTPQLALRSALARAIELAEADRFVATDDVSLLEHAGIPVEIVPSSARNLKITTPADLALAEQYALEERI